MTDLRKAAEMALETLEEINKFSIGENAICLPAEIDGAMEALRQALAQSEQEPVAWVIEDGEVDYYTDVVAKIKPGTPLYTAPPKREWVGLTDKDKDAFWRADQMTSEEWGELFAAVEAKLKEKNT